MKTKLTKRAVEAVLPTSKDEFLWDTELPGFGAKITPKGARIYLMQYWRQGRARRFTLGRHGVLTCEEARREAIRIKGEVAGGTDPAGLRASDRAAPTLETFADRYLADHARLKKKPLSVAADERNLRNHVLPAMGRMKLVDISRADVARLHQGMRETPGAANRCLALLSKMFNLAERWGLRPDGSNPCRHVEKYRERRIERFLSAAELVRLGAILDIAEQEGANPSIIGAVRLLAFSGCRRDEVLTLRWDDVDLERACLRLPDSKTGQKTVPLGAPALEVLAAQPRRDDNPYVFPGTWPGSHFVGLEKAWQRLRTRAELEDVRLHDLRHSFASMGAAMGEGLPIIGALLGHADAATTNRYAHLSNDPLRAAADRISGSIAATMQGSAGNVVQLPIAGDQSYPR